VLLQREDAGRLLAALPPEYRLLSSEPEKLLQQLVHRQGDALDDSYIEDWLRKFEQALDDSTLVRFYREMRYTN